MLYEVITDQVMGGRSVSRAELADGALLFAGDLSLEHGGGFASIRSPAADFGLQGCTGLTLLARA